MTTSCVIFFGFLVIFCINCAISADDAVRKLLDGLGIEKDLKDLDAEERAVVIGRVAEKYVPQSNNDMEQRMETLEEEVADLELTFSGIDTNVAKNKLMYWMELNKKEKSEG